MAAGAMVGGTLLSMYGQYSSAQAEASAAKTQSALKEAQASEVLRRARLDEKTIIREGDQLLGTQKAVQVGQGGSVASGNLIMAQADAQYNILKELMTNRDEAEFTANQVRAGAASDRDLSKRRQTASYIGMAGTLMTSSYNYSKASGKI